MNEDDLARRIQHAIAARVVEDRSPAYTEIATGLDAFSPFLERYDRLAEELTEYWISEYVKRTLDEPQILEFSDGAYRYLFDLTLDRVVAAWGPSWSAEASRDMTRQAGFLRGFTYHHPGKDRGHFMSHAQGGLMDVNFFPQKREVNRGWSPGGKLYRRMEKHCAETPGTFCFSLPIYDISNRTWDPNLLEYGLLLGGRLWVVAFPN